jgi:hypothetical protein
MIARSLLDQSTAAELKIFYSYARPDESWRRELDRVLPEFQWDVAVRTWYDGDIEPGTEWAGEIDRNLAAADLILLFVGQAFLDSDYCRQVELPAAMRRHRDGEARVVPIILEKTTPDWRTLDFGRLQCLPQNGVPLRDWDDHQQALRDVAQGLVELVMRHGLRPTTRMRWELHLEGDATAFSAEDRHATAEELRRATADQTVRCVSVRQGSTVLTMESTQDAMAWMSRAFDVGELRTLLGRPIRKVLRLFGASVQAISTTRVTQQDAPPPERMLLPSRTFEPAQIQCVIVDPDEPLARLESLFYTGDAEPAETAEATAKLMDFFRTGLAVAETDLYVNLAPNESAKLLPPSLTGTRMGVGLLEFDYRLKRLAASLLHPDLETGRQFWAEVTARCREESSKRDEPLEVPAFQRVWVVPDQAELYEGPSFAQFERDRKTAPMPRLASTKDRPFAYVLRQRMKALTVGEYAAARSAGTTDRVTTICDQVFREIVLPVIQREIDEGENFAELRQIYQSVLLAFWFKKSYGSHPAVVEYINSGHPEWLRVNIGEIEHWGPQSSPDLNSAMPQASVQATAAGAARIRALPEYNAPENREYFERYMDVFDTGVFYLQRNELIEGTSLTRARAYFAGAIDFRRTRDAMRHV